MSTLLASLLSSAAIASDVPHLTASPDLARRAPAGIEYLVATVSEQGSLVDCQARLSDGSAYQDIANCRALRKARFQPAKDDNGQAVYSTVVFGLIWQRMPDRGKPAVITTMDGPKAPDTLYLAVNRLPTGAGDMPNTNIRVVVAPTDAVDSCDVAKPSGSAVLDKLACASGPSAAHLLALRGTNGEPVRSLRLLRVFFAAP